jgi:transposase
MAVPKCRAVFEHLEVVETGRRRRWTEDEKLRIVAESQSGSRLVSSTARRHGISRSLLTTWRRQFGGSLAVKGKPAPSSYRR